MRLKAKVIFFGTPSFSAYSLAKLYENNIDIKLVVTAKDKPKGRGLKLTMTPVKAAALKYGLNVATPEKLSKAFIEEILKIDFNIIVAVATRFFIPMKLIKAVNNMAVNLHASFLPRWRGPAPINFAILNGDKYTGVTTIFMSKKIDAGDIILQEKEGILANDTASSLHDRLMVKGADLLVKTVKLIETGDFRSIKQDESKATYSRKLVKSDGKVEFSEDIYSIDRKIRAFFPWPGAYFEFRKKRINIISAAIAPGTSNLSTGEILGVENDALKVQCSNGIILLKELKPESSKKMTGREFYNGYLKGKTSFL